MMGPDTKTGVGLPEDKGCTPGSNQRQMLLASWEPTGRPQGSESLGTLRLFKIKYLLDPQHWRGKEHRRAER